MSLQEPNDGKKPPVKKEKMTGGVNLKKSIAKKSKPKDTESNGKLGPLHTICVSIFLNRARDQDSWAEPKSLPRLSSRQR